MWGEQEPLTLINVCSDCGHPRSRVIQPTLLPPGTMVRGSGEQRGAGRRGDPRLQSLFRVHVLVALSPHQALAMGAEEAEHRRCQKWGDGSSLRLPHLTSHCHGSSSAPSVKDPDPSPGCLKALRSPMAG